MIVLKGKATLNNPSIGAIGKEITNLSSYDADKITLEKDHERLQVSPTGEKGEYFISLSIEETIGEGEEKKSTFVNYAQKSKCNYSQTIDILSKYITTKKFEANSKWIKLASDNEIDDCIYYPKEKYQLFKNPLFYLFLLLIIVLALGYYFAIIKNPDTWQDSLQFFWDKINSFKKL